MRFLSDLHNHLGMAVLVILGLAVVLAIIKWRTKAEYKSMDKYMYLAASSLVEFQVLLGLLLYIMKGQWSGFAQMDVFAIRFFTVEHPLGMLIAVALVSIGRGRSKKVEDAVKKHRTVALFFGIGFLVLLLSIPWDFRF